MEYLAIFVIVVSIAILGILISVGNNRQRKAIDGIRKQIAGWAEQDIRLKREKMVREIKIDDPLPWFNKIAAQVLGENQGLAAEYETATAPEAIVFHNKVNSRRIIFSTADMAEIKHLVKGRKSRISGASNHPLLRLSPKSPDYELTILNAGMFFDLEAPLAWKAATGNEISGVRLWMFLD